MIERRAWMRQSCPDGKSCEGGHPSTPAEYAYLCKTSLMPPSSALQLEIFNPQPSYTTQLTLSSLMSNAPIAAEAESVNVHATGEAWHMISQWSRTPPRTRGIWPKKRVEYCSPVSMLTTDTTMLMKMLRSEKPNQRHVSLQAESVGIVKDPNLKSRALEASS